MKHLKTQQQLNEASENLNISDVSGSDLSNDDKWTLIYVDFIKNPKNTLSSGDLFQWLRKRYKAPEMK
jgi:hypothetical protein